MIYRYSEFYIKMYFSTVFLFTGSQPWYIPDQVIIISPQYETLIWKLLEIWVFESITPGHTHFITESLYSTRVSLFFLKKNIKCFSNYFNIQLNLALIKSELNFHYFLNCYCITENHSILIKLMCAISYRIYKKS